MTQRPKDPVDPMPLPRPMPPHADPHHRRPRHHRPHPRHLRRPRPTPNRPRLTAITTLAAGALLVFTLTALTTLDVDHDATRIAGAGLIILAAGLYLLDVILDP